MFCSYVSEHLRKPGNPRALPVHSVSSVAHLTDSPASAANQKRPPRFLVPALPAALAISRAGALPCLAALVRAHLAASLRIDLHSAY